MVCYKKLSQKEYPAIRTIRKRAIIIDSVYTITRLFLRGMIQKLVLRH
ncbi:hypothetical protein WALBB_1140014 [Wolbachia pipientis wAlbB]|nr:hypothetical protein WALBB_1140014 [Wolbachia pipientis wAlbB]